MAKFLWLLTLKKDFISFEMPVFQNPESIFRSYPAADFHFKLPRTRAGHTSTFFICFWWSLNYPCPQLSTPRGSLAAWQKLPHRSFSLEHPMPAPDTLRLELTNKQRYFLTQKVGVPKTHPWAWWGGRWHLASRGMFCVAEVLISVEMY